MIIDRIKQYIDYLGISNNSFTRTVGLSNGFLKSGLSASRSIGSDIVEKILQCYPDLNPIWLITGNGSMLISKGNENVSIYNSDRNAHKNAHILDVKQNVHNTLASVEESGTSIYTRESANLYIPFLPSRTFSLVQSEPDLARFEKYRIPGLSDADFLMPYYNEDMLPTVTAGNIIAGKIIKKAPIYTYGRIHMLELEEIGVVMGRLQPGVNNDTVICEPENPVFKTIEVPIENIIAIALLMAVIKILK